MPAFSPIEAPDRLAEGVESATPNVLPEIHAELFPEKPAVAAPSAADLAQPIRTELEAEELVDLWNVVFPAARNVWYDEEDEKLHFDEEEIGYAEAD